MKGFWNVRCHKCSALNLVFLTGHANRSEPREMILPVSCDSQLSPATMQEYAKNVKLEGYDTHGYGIFTQLIATKQMSIHEKKHSFCICKNKGTDQLCRSCTADQLLCFRYLDGTIRPLSKSEISSL